MYHYWDYMKKLVGKFLQGILDRSLCLLCAGVANNANQSTFYVEPPKLN